MQRSTVELELDPKVSEQVQRIARDENCTIESVLEESLSLLYGNVVDSSALLDRLRSCNDEQLWGVVYQRLTPSQDNRMRDLLYRGNEGALTEQERSEMDYFLGLVDRQMLLRSKALALLKERGHDIDNYLNSRLEVE